MILTGGSTYYDYNTTPRVVEYDENGYVRDLPQLQFQRRNHGCGSYVNQDGTKVDIDINHTTYMYVVILSARYILLLVAMELSGRLSPLQRSWRRLGQPGT